MFLFVMPTRFIYLFFAWLLQQTDLAARFEEYYSQQ
jgi:hypothetical protein